MATTPTKLSVPSEKPQDLKFNAGKIDEFVTSMAQQYLDRFGSAHYTIEGLRWLTQQAIARFGWIPAGTFQNGATLTLPNQIIKDETDGEYYRWDGSFLPDGKVVPPDSDPSSTGGFGIGTWIGIGDSWLRSELSKISSMHIPAISAAMNMNYQNGKVWEPGGFASAGDWFVFDNNGMPEIWDGVGVMGISPTGPFQKIVSSVSMPKKPFIPAYETPKINKTFIKFNPSASINFIELVYSVGSSVSDTTVILKNYSSSDEIEFNEDPTGLGIVFAVQDDKAGTNASYRRVTLTATRVGVDMHVTIPGTTDMENKYLRFSLRCRDATVSFDKAVIYANNRVVAHSALEWMGSDSYREFVDAGSDFAVKCHSYPGSMIASDSAIRVSPWGGNTFTGEILSFAKAYDFYAASSDDIKKIEFEEGVYYTQRRTYQWIIKNHCSLFSKNGATILGGVELPTASWSELSNTSRKTFYAPYDPTSNVDMAIRAGTKQPYVYVEMQSAANESAYARALTRVSSVDEVKGKDFSYYYDFATQRVYFSWDANNRNAYVWVCESDNVFNVSGQYNVEIYNITAKAAKSHIFNVTSDTYAKTYQAKFYNCTGAVTYSGNGFGFTNYDCVLYNCNGLSAGNDGAGFHDNGVSYIIGGRYNKNADDGISHHENCVGYVVGAELCYNGAGNSTPAFGATVYHWDCLSKKANTVKPKPYAGTLACISGQDHPLTTAYYWNCETDYGYYAQSQQGGTTAKLCASGRYGSDSGIVSTSSTIVVKTPDITL